MNKVQQIHDSLVNGQRKQMVDQINEYGSDFWQDYKDLLSEMYDYEHQLEYFQDAVISYFRIKNR